MCTFQWPESVHFSVAIDTVRPHQPEHPVLAGPDYPLGRKSHLHLPLALALGTDSPTAPSGSPSPAPPSLSSDFPPRFPRLSAIGTPEARRISTRSAYTLERATRHDSHTPSPAGGPDPSPDSPARALQELPQLVSVPPLFFSSPFRPCWPPSRNTRRRRSSYRRRDPNLPAHLADVLPRAIAATRPRAFRCSLHRFGRPFRPSSGCSPKSCSSDLRDTQCLLLNHCPAPPLRRGVASPTLSPSSLLQAPKSGYLPNTTAANRRRSGSSRPLQANRWDLHADFLRW